MELGGTNGFFTWNKRGTIALDNQGVTTEFGTWWVLEWFFGFFRGTIRVENQGVRTKFGTS